MKQMAVRLHLKIPAKLLAGFAANLLLLAIGFTLVFQAQFGSATNELFAAIAEPRIQAVAQRIGEDLRMGGREGWDEVLRLASSRLDIEFALFDAELRPMAGEIQELPPEVVQQVRAGLIRRRPPPRHPPQEPPPPEDGFEPPMPPHPPGWNRPPHREPEPEPMNPALSSYPKMTARSGSPRAYWVFSMVPVIDSPRGYLPLVLAMRSDSLTGKGVFFDPMPWVYAGMGVLLVSGLIWVPLAIDLTQSLRRIGRATGRIAEGDFAVSVPDASRQDELGDLGRSVQVLAETLDAQVMGQKRFLSDVAHELCSPISRLQAALGILEVRTDEASRAQGLARINTEVQQIGMLVNELLNFSKANLKREVNLQRLELGPFVRAVVEREEAASAEIRIDIPDGVEVRADEVLLGRALGNLLRNAIRYAGHAGGIVIQARRNGEEIEIRVQDSGPGVPKESMGRLFEPFYRPDPARTRETGGVGLGLAIVKTCVEACRGTVGARLRESGGLEVTVRLPGN
jgi:two-component system sensor histidine kinase CpxA